MKKISKIFLWLLLLNKRMLKKTSFLVILCSIPLLVQGVNLMAEQESGVLKIVLCTESAEDELALEFIESLTQDPGVMQFLYVQTMQEAKQIVQSGQADAAWIFHTNLQDNIDRFTADVFKREPAVTIIAKEDNVALQLAREKLFGILYGNVSYSMYRHYVTEEVLKEETLSDAILWEHYDKTRVEGNIFEMKYLDGETVNQGTSYLTFPVRGLLTLVIMLCGLASGMFYLQDEAKGTFTWLPVHTNVLWSWGYLLPGLLNVGAAAVIALALSGVFMGWGSELFFMLLYIIMVIGFSSVIRRLCGSIVRLGAIIPGLLLVMLAVCPIFMGAPKMRAIQCLLPPFYYLNALHNQLYLYGMLIYIVLIYSIDFVLMHFITKK